MRRAAWLLFAALLSGCATAAYQAPPGPTRSPTATPVPAVPTATPTPTPAPTPPPPPTPLPAPPSAVSPPLVRVLLTRDDGEVVFPQPGRPYRATWDQGSTWLWGPLRAAAGTNTLWQVGAWRDAATAAEAAGRLAGALGGTAVVTRETTEKGLVRVQVQWPAGAPDDAAARLASLGFEQAFAVAGAAYVRVTDGHGTPVTATRIGLEPVGEWPTAVAGGRYHGRFELRASGHDVLVVNHLNLEAYLKGVVPAEMGPAAFPELEALKAQAVAARTYTVAHLGDHEDEGYDLCDTPACQVYRGVAVEHRLTNRAVEETAGIIATYGGKPIDAMYTSTCGGHTEDAAELFPDRAQPYLKGVVCAWERPLGLAGTAPDSVWFEGWRFASEVAARVLGVAPDARPTQVLAQVRAACSGGAALGTAPRDAEGYARRLLAAGGLDGAAAVHGGAGTSVQRLLRLADLYGARLEPPPARWDGGWQLDAAFAVLQMQGVVKHDRGEAVPRPDGVGIYPRRADASEVLPSPVPLYERWDRDLRRVQRATVLPGTTLERYRAGDRVVALVIRRSGGDGEADRRSAWRSWVRELSWSELERRLGFSDLAKLEITRRSPSGRVVGLTAVGRSGRRKEWSGFDVRQALGLPETLFSMQRLTRPDGEDVVRFLGRGWGHGVGLCQNGAYGLARAGRTYDQILTTYYPGTSLLAWQPDAPATSPPGGR